MLSLLRLVFIIFGSFFNLYSLYNAIQMLCMIILINNCLFFSNGCFSEWLRRSQEKHSSVKCPECRAVVQFVGKNPFLHNIEEVIFLLLLCWLDIILLSPLCFVVWCSFDSCNIYLVVHHRLWTQVEVHAILIVCFVMVIF